MKWHFAFCLLWLMSGLSLADPMTNADMTVARGFVDWIEHQQGMGIPSATIVSAIKTNDAFIASNVWVACFDFAFNTNDVSASVDGYGRRVDVAVCLRPFCGIETTPDMHEAYTRFCDIGSYYSFGVLNDTNSVFISQTNDLAVLKRHFLKLMNNGPFFRRIWQE